MNTTLLPQKEVLINLEKYITIDLKDTVFLMNELISILNKYNMLFEQKHFIIKNCTFLNIEETQIFNESLNFKEEHKVYEFLEYVKNLNIIFEDCNFYFINNNYYESFSLNFSNYFFQGENNFYFTNLSKKMEHENNIIKDMYKNLVVRNNVYNIQILKEGSTFVYDIFTSLLLNPDIKFYLPRNILIHVSFNLFNSIKNIDEFVKNSKINFKNIFEDLDDKKIFQKDRILNQDNLDEFKTTLKNSEYLFDIFNETKKMDKFQQEKYKHLFNFITDEYIK